jgi:hypothetical protein
MDVPTIIAARSEMQFEQIRLLFRSYQRETEALAEASGACP